MRVIKPEWLRHDADKKKLTAIFSLDFHPDGTRLATAGMDNKIRIWNTQAIAKESTENTENTENKRLLSTLVAHSGAVMCVRFSQDSGQYLASGADDMVVLIWERDQQSTQSNLGDDDSSETWRPVRRLAGHESDVCDIAWSPGNRFLATCGLDNTVHIWDGQTFARVTKLTAHDQFVKGLTFDPAGRYLATQSDDKTLRIWRTSDWALHKTISSPFQDNIYSTYFRRPSWSPDGDCIAAANAVNGKVPVAAVIARETWATDLSFVGHRAAIEAVSFNPRLSTIQGKNTSICAAGGQDYGVSVWLTSQHMPIVAATNLFAGNLLDLAWHSVAAKTSSDEEVIAYLAACSYDGSVAVLEFTQAELGTPLSAEAQQKVLVERGWMRRSLEENAAAPKNMIAETPAQLRLEEQGKKMVEESEQPRIRQTIGSIPSSTGNSSSAMPAPVRNRDGKKRVAPLFVRSIGGSATTRNEQPQQQPVVTTTITTSQQQPPVSGERLAVDAPVWIESRVLGTRHSLKRPKEVEGDSASIVTVAQQSAPLGPQTLVHAQSISAARVHLSIPKLVVQLKITQQQASLVAYNNSADKKQKARLVYDNKWTKYLSRPVVCLAASDSVTAACLNDGSMHWFDTQSGMRLAPPLMNEALPAHLACRGSLCLLVDAVGQVSVWDAVKMEALVDKASLAPLLYTAQLPEISSEEEEEEEEEDMVRAPKRHKPMVALTAIDIVESTSSPIVCLSDGRSFTYHTRLRNWLRVSDPQEYLGSDYYVRGSSRDGNMFVPAQHPSTQLSRIQELGYHQYVLQQQTNQKKKQKRQMLDEMSTDISDPKRSTSSLDIRRTVTLDHLEHQLKAASVLGSADDVVRYVDIMARQLASLGNKERASYWLHEMLDDDSLAGMPKRQLLKDRILPLLATNRQLQSLVTEYADALK